MASETVESRPRILSSERPPSKREKAFSLIKLKHGKLHSLTRKPATTSQLTDAADRLTTLMWC